MAPISKFRNQPDVRIPVSMRPARGALNGRQELGTGKPWGILDAGSGRSTCHAGVGKL